MKKDKKIKNIITNLEMKCKDYLSFVNFANECAATDRKIEGIIEELKELNKLYYGRYKFLNKKSNDKDLI